MAIYKFYISMCEEGVIEVEADNLEDARDMAYELDGKYLSGNTEVTYVEQIK